GPRREGRGPTRPWTASPAGKPRALLLPRRGQSPPAGRRVLASEPLTTTCSDAAPFLPASTRRPCRVLVTVTTTTGGRRPVFLHKSGPLTSQIGPVNLTNRAR